MSMLPDFEMINYTFGENDATIVPIFDVHLGAAEFMEKEWMSFLEMVEKTPNMYLVLGGDLINNNIRSSVADIWKEQMSPSAQKKLMAQMLEPVKDRILCSVTGNHERRSSRDADDDPCYDIMCKLDIEDRHRENIAFVTIRMGKQVRDNGVRSWGEERPVYNLVVTHGSGGGIYTGTAVLRAERYGYTIDGADLLIVGHSHKPFTTQPGKIVIDSRNNKVSVKPFKVVNATSWLDYSPYAAQKMMLPTTHCLHTITLCGNHKEMIVTM